LKFDIGQQQIIGHGCPDLSHDRVFGGTQERFYFEMLLDPLEEEFNVPTGFVELGDGQSRKFEVVGEEVVGVFVSAS